MSRRPGAPYKDEIKNGGKTLIYEGHDRPRTAEFREPKKMDQPKFSESGRITQNGLFWKAVSDYKAGRAPAAEVRVYDKIKDGIWTYVGLFELVDGWVRRQRGRRVFKFELCISERGPDESGGELQQISHNRLIPPEVKLEVWKRDKGKCVLCGAVENLHFDHILPFSKGGTSLLAGNVQILCAKHNLKKHNRIE